MVLFHVPDFDRPACTKPEHLPLVDAAFDKPGGPAGDLMRKALCTGCPAFDACLTEAMTSGEWGMWAGTTGNARTRAGAPKPIIKRSKVA